MNNLHPLEIFVLRLEIVTIPFSVNDVICNNSVLNIGQCNQAFSWLLNKKLIIEQSRLQEVYYELTELGKQLQKEGLPEEKIISLINSDGPLTIPQLSSKLKLSSREIGSAYGVLSRAEIAIMNSERKVDIINKDKKIILRSLLNRLTGGRIKAEKLNTEEQKQAIIVSRKRGSSKGLIRILEKEIIFYSLTEYGNKIRNDIIKSGLTGLEEKNFLTKEMLADGSWKKVNFRHYNVSIPFKRVLLGRKNSYSVYLDQVRDQFVSLGFEEFDGPLVETNFWCCDALFMPQFHAARDEHDVYFIKEPRHSNHLPDIYLDNVAATHIDGWYTGSRGWGYQFNHNFARRIILRSHGTAVSAQKLTCANIPGKYFGIMRCFRPDKVDASHLSDFYQTEGIVLSKQANLKTLLGLLKLFAEKIAGVDSVDVRYEPAYFPFTEPSVEMFVRHPKVGWIELGGAGIFRPEVTLPLGVKVPVIAWGLGIDRMAMISLGINDIRDLFSTDLEYIRNYRSKKNNI